MIAAMAPLFSPEVRRRTLGLFIPSAVAVTICLIAVFAGAQHVYRSDANDPQYQMAEDAAHRLDAGAEPADVIPAGPRVDLGASLAPFIAVYDSQGTPQASNSVLDGVNGPTPPQSVLDQAVSRNPDVITWQPRDGVRMAIVAFPWKGGTVVAGRSLTLIEQRTSDLLTLLILGGVAALAIVLAASFAGARLLVTAETVRTDE